MRSFRKSARPTVIRVRRIRHQTRLHARRTDQTTSLPDMSELVLYGQA
jgi:hypothetical protein